MEEAFEHRSTGFSHFAEELGDCLFAIVNLARWTGLDPEKLLNDNVTKYLKRCSFIEDNLSQAGKQWQDISKDEIYRLWKEAKKSGL